jgi:hypothetical protein
MQWEGGAQDRNLYGLEQKNNIFMDLDEKIGSCTNEAILLTIFTQNFWNFQKHIKK